MPSTGIPDSGFCASHRRLLPFLNANYPRPIPSSEANARLADLEQYTMCCLSCSANFHRLAQIERVVRTRSRAAESILQLTRLSTCLPNNLFSSFLGKFDVLCKLMQESANSHPSSGSWDELRADLCEFMVIAMIPWAALWICRSSPPKSVNVLLPGDNYLDRLQDCISGKLALTQCQQVIYDAQQHFKVNERISGALRSSIFQSKAYMYPGSPIQLDGILQEPDIVWNEGCVVSQSGRTSDVFRGWLKTGEDVAVKRFRNFGDGKAKKQLEKESDIWKSLKHPRILPCITVFSLEEAHYLVSPFAAGGSLSRWLQTRWSPFPLAVNILAEIAEGLVYLHESGIVHGDVKADNILLTKENHALLSDFGLSKLDAVQTSMSSKGSGTLRWQSPELWDDGPRTFASDMYAFGMTIAEVVNKRVPFAHIEKDTAVIVAAITRQERPIFKPCWSSDQETLALCQKVWSVGETCWPTDPSARITAGEARDLLS